MVTLYTWLPTKPSDVVEDGIPADIGHSAMAVASEEGVDVYVSFWPELDGLIGRLSHPAKPRSERNPSSYSVESDRQRPYMQRPADYEDEVAGLDSGRLYTAWQSIGDLPYDLQRWNCSDVTRLLLLVSMEPALLGAVLRHAEFSTNPLKAILHPRETVIEAASAHLALCTPTDTRRLAMALNAAQASVSGKPDSLSDKLGNLIGSVLHKRNVNSDGANDSGAV